MEDAPFEIRVHDGEKHLQKQIDGIDEDGREIQPRFAQHLVLLSLVDDLECGLCGIMLWAVELSSLALEVGRCWLVCRALRDLSRRRSLDVVDCSGFVCAMPM